jgi:hypothetical protein
LAAEIAIGVAVGVMVGVRLGVSVRRGRVGVGVDPSGDGGRSLQAANPANNRSSKAANWAFFWNVFITFTHHKGH